MANIVLSDGKNVVISNVLFNKEQKINVPKTYVTTVKKAVTKVSEDFYKVKNDLENTKVIETSPNDIIDKASEALVESTVEMTMPELNLEQPLEEKMPTEVNESTESIEANMPQVDVVKPIDQMSVGVQQLPQVEQVKEDVVPSATQATPIIESEPVIPSVSMPESQEVKSPEVLPVDEAKKAELNGALSAAPLEQTKVNEAPIIPQTLEIPNVEKNEGVVPPIVPEINPLPVEPTVIPEVSAPINEQINSTEPKLFFDGSNESNLNKALGEISEEKVVVAPQDGLESLREFGEDQPVVSAPAQENVKTLTRSKGFANNKFFMVIAIAFFIAACVFLGYEAFQYFQLVK